MLAPIALLLRPSLPLPRGRPAVAAIEYQPEEGARGREHLSAFVQDNDLTVYQTGTWLVDNVEVGDGSDAVWRLALICNVQINWTHNCEHGVLRGFAAQYDPATGEVVCDETVDVQYGPEQLVARLDMADELPASVIEMLHEDSVLTS